MKIKKQFKCTQCGNIQAKWMGKCQSCGSWDTYVEESVSVKNESQPNHPSQGLKRLSKIGEEVKKTVPLPLSAIFQNESFKIPLQDKELERVLGGGLVPGASILIGGEPGIGKSTILLQLAFSFKEARVLYICGEESLPQVKLRATRLGLSGENVLFFSETNLEEIIKSMQNIEPAIMIVDSIQTIYSKEVENATGSITQVRECSSTLIQYSKSIETTLFLVGHITKDGNIAGPKLLEHLVDTVLYFEGEKDNNFRMLRCYKNRFGNIMEIGMYSMNENGLIPVENPAGMMLMQRIGNPSGVAISSLQEGSRILMLEVQALVTPSPYAVPQRTATGFDMRRFQMLLAILEKKCGILTNKFDVFLNIAGGIKVNDPAIDLAICAAIASSYYDLPLPEKSIFIGEVGLTGEVRPGKNLKSRINESYKLGFRNMYFFLDQELKSNANFKLNSTDSLGDMLRSVFAG